MVREKTLENGTFSRSGKSYGISFSVREIRKDEKKIMEKSWNFNFFPKKSFLLTGFWKLYFPLFASNIRKGMFLNINCEQFMFRNMPFLISMV